MSVCFFVPAADQASTSAAVDDGAEIETITDDQQHLLDKGEQQISHFWTKVNEDIRKVTPDHFKTQALPLARIKKIMKLDEDVKMISAEAPFLFAKAAEIFIHELTLRAWSHTEDNKRRTLQRNDIAMAISKSDQFDFLIDIVPRQEVKMNKVKEDPPRATVTEQITHHPQSSLHTTQQQQIVVPCTQLIQQPATSSATSSGSQQPVTLVQQLVTPSGEVQQLPIQLSQAQLNMIRLQMQNNPNQPIIIQAQPQAAPQPQIIQVSSQTQHQNQPQQLYITQVQAQDQES